MSEMTYAILDTADNCWLGDDSGPKTFDDFMLARVAAQVWETQVYGTDLGARYKAVEYLPAALRLKDHVETKMNTLKALQRIEGSAGVSEPHAGSKAS